MSQYPPSPYSVPYQPYPAGYHFDPYGQYLRPAKRAAILMWILGGLMLAGGVCCGLLGTAVSSAQIPPESRAQLEEIESQLRTVGMSLTSLFVVMGIAAALPGLAMLIVAFFVRRGTLGGVISGLILTCLMVLGVLFVIIAGAVQMIGGHQPGGAAGICVYFVPLILLVLELVWLIQALRASSQVRGMQAQYQSQYYQYQQQQQAYAQQYGYAQPPAPPPPPQMPPPPPDPGPPTSQPPPPPPSEGPGVS